MEEARGREGKGEKRGYEGGGRVWRMEKGKMGSREN